MDRLDQKSILLQVQADKLELQRKKAEAQQAQADAQAEPEPKGTIFSSLVLEYIIFGSDHGMPARIKTTSKIIRNWSIRLMTGLPEINLEGEIQVFENLHELEQYMRDYISVEVLEKIKREHNYKVYMEECNQNK